jgi:hypothetical protein
MRAAVMRAKLRFVTISSDLLEIALTLKRANNRSTKAMQNATAARSRIVSPAVKLNPDIDSRFYYSILLTDD